MEALLYIVVMQINNFEQPYSMSYHLFKVNNKDVMQISMDIILVPLMLTMNIYHLIKC